MKYFLIVSLALVFILSSCKSNEPDAFSYQTATKGDSYQMKEPTIAKTAAAQPSASIGPAMQMVKDAEEAKPVEPAVIDRKVIQNGEFTLETKTPTEDQRKIAAIASTLGGFVVTSEFQQSASERTSSVSVIVRVPAANFQKATDEIRKTGIRVLHEKLTGQDVTAEYIDLEARLRAKKALEAQYFEIMKRASKISDVLEVQEKLTEVRTEIEQHEGRRRYLENQSTLSTINISLQTPTPLVAATQTGFWASIKNSFGDGVDVAVAIVLGIIHFVIVMLPVVVLLLLPAGLIARFLWKRVSWPRKEPIGIVPPTQ